MRLPRRLLDDLKILNEKPLDWISQLEPNAQNLLELYATIAGPDGSAFEGGNFRLKMQFTNEYPQTAPKVSFVSKVFHPNVNENGLICLDILNAAWNPSFDAKLILAAIRQFLDYPNLDSPVNKLAADVYVQNIDDYEQRVRNICQESCCTKLKQNSVAPSMNLSPISSWNPVEMARNRLEDDYFSLLQQNNDLQNFRELSLDLKKLQLTGQMVGPLRTPFEGVIFDFLIEFQQFYPKSAAMVTFQTPIYHPNFTDDGRVDCRLFSCGVGGRLESILLKLRSLMYKPNPDFVANREALKVFEHLSNFSRARLEIELKSYGQNRKMPQGVAGIKPRGDFLGHDWLIELENRSIISLEIPNGYPFECPLIPGSNFNCSEFWTPAKDLANLAEWLTAKISTMNMKNEE